MSLKTKKALAAALKSAMEKKPLSKITVSELIKECDINRKPFYYHFEDIYALLKWMFEQEAIDVVKNFDMIVNTEEAFNFVMDYVEKNKHIINCAYDSMGYEEIKRFFYNDFYGIVRDTIENGEQKLNISVDKNFKDFLANFYTEAIAGMLVEWVKNRLTEDRDTALWNVMFICRISIPQILTAKAEEEINSGTEQEK